MEGTIGEKETNVGTEKYEEVELKMRELHANDWREFGSFPELG